MTQRVNLVGQVFHRLTVTAFIEMRPSGRSGRRVAYWRCRCECGGLAEVSSGNLRSGAVKSCGCLKIEVHTRHGRYRVPSGLATRLEYSSWAAMIRRCVDPRDNAWDRYGGAGVTVCERWLSFPNFLADMPPRPSRKYTIDRIDGTKGYEPGNCRWATAKQQANNRSTNVVLEHDGLRLTVAEWAIRLGVGDHVIHNRLKRGWPVGRALQGKCHEKDRVIEFRGQSKPASEWAGRIGLTLATFMARLHAGWSVEEAVTVPKGKHRPKRTPTADES